MLFNSYVFIFLFLPLTLAGFFLLGRFGRYRLATGWLTAASLFFYAWWNPPYLALLVASILFNYGVGSLLRKFPQRGILALGVSFNLGLLGYYKYSNFFLENLGALAEKDFNLAVIILPLGISFFTFQQVAFLIDTLKSCAVAYRFLDYCLFVTFFPQLIAGPIVHHKEMFPQFAQRAFFKLSPRTLQPG